MQNQTHESMVELLVINSFDIQRNHIRLRYLFLILLTDSIDNSFIISVIVSRFPYPTALHSNTVKTLQTRI